MFWTSWKPFATWTDIKRKKFEKGFLLLKQIHLFVNGKKKIKETWS